MGHISIYGILHRLLERVEAAERRSVFRKLKPLHAMAVLSGPFAGLRYPVDFQGSQYIQQLLGSYELELHTSIMELLASSHRTVINVGCAEGYYAVGFARSKPDCHVFAFDLDPVAQARCRRTAVLNGVDGRVSIDGECRLDSLRALLNGQSIVISDCEGAEMTLLDPASVPGLKNATIVAELHDALLPGIGREMYRRFTATHRLTFIPSSLRDPLQYPILGTLSPRKQLLAITERRLGRQEWVVMQPNGTR